MRTIQGSVYDYPKYYDLVYGSDWKAELDFLLGCFDQFVDGDVQRVFEPACGTGRLLYRMGKLGIEGHGNDLNPHAVKYCNERVNRHQLPVKVEVGDMSRFVVTEKFDAAFNTINSFRHLNSEELAYRHLVCVRDAVRPGGIYVLGLHLAPLVGETCDGESWSASRGHLTVNTSIELLERNYPERFEKFSMTSDIYTPTDSFRINDQLIFRTYTAQQIKQLIDRVEGIRIESVFDFSYDLTTPIELDSSVEDVVLILKRN